MKYLIGIVAGLVILASGVALAAADGPDYFQLRGKEAVSLYDRMGAGAVRIGTLPVKAEGLRNLGCRGLPAYAEWSAMDGAARDAARQNAWCRVAFLGKRGWVRQVHLAEGTAGRGPGFDCARAAGQVEEMICADPALALLDRQMNAAFRQAVEVASELEERPADAVSLLRANQRGWIKGRNDCWKDSDVKACIEEVTSRRLSALHVDWTLVPPASQHSYRCGDNAGAVLSYYDLLPRPAVAVEFGDRRAVFVANGELGRGRYDGLAGRWVELRGNYALLKLDQDKPAWQCAGI